MIGFPLGVGIALVILPFVAPTGERSPRRRPWAVATVALALISIASLVHLGQRAPWSPVLADQTLPASVTEGLSGNAAQGAQLFQDEDCISCHTIAGVGGERGPDLTTAASRLSREQLTLRILSGGQNMPAFGETLSPDETGALVEFLAQRQAQP